MRPSAMQHAAIAANTDHPGRFWEEPFSTKQTEAGCRDQWGVEPRTLWATVEVSGWGGFWFGEGSLAALSFDVHGRAARRMDVGCD